MSNVTTGSSKRVVGARTALDVALVDGSGNQITTFGGTGGTSNTDGDAFTPNTTLGTPLLGAYQSAVSAVTDGDLAVASITANRELRVSVTSGGTAGTQYTEADTDSTITGTALMMEDAANTLVAATGNVANGLDVDVTRSALPTGAATSANQSTAITSLQLIDDPIATIGATPLMRVAIFDGANNQVTTFGGGTQYTEDAVAAADPVGTALIMVRADTLGAVTSTDGDNIAARATNKGEQYVKHVDAIPVTDNAGSLTVDNGGTFAVQATIASGASSFVHAEDDASGNLDAGAGMLAVRKATPANTSSTDGDYEFLQMSAGRLWASATIDAALPAGTNAIGKLAANAGVTIGAVEIAAAQTLATVTTVGTVTNVVHVDDNAATLSVDWNGTQPVTGSGTATGALRVELPTNGTGVIATVGAVTAITNALPAGTNAIGKLAANAGVTIGAVEIAAAQTLATVTTVGAVTAITNALPAGTNAIGKLATNSGVTIGAVEIAAAQTVATTNAGTFAVQPGPSATNGLSIFRTISLVNGSLQVVKASAGAVYGMWVTNTATSTRFIKFYDAISGTAGTGTPVITIGIPGNSNDDISGNFGPGGMGIGFSTGICIGATTGVADADTGAPSANDVIVNVFFK